MKKKTRIELLREQKKISQRALARATGLSDYTIRKLETDPERYRSCSLKNLKKIADYFGISVIDLIDEDLL